jgi:hypothetical protein
MNYRGAVVALLCIVACIARAGESVTLVKPVYAEVYLRTAQTQKISGSVLRYDDDGFVIKSSGSEREIKWLDLTGTSAYALRARLIDRSKPQDWLTVGEMAWSLGATEPAQRAFDAAIKLDASYKSKVDQIKSNPAGSAVKAPAAATTSQAAQTTNDSSSADGVVKYLKSTPEQDAAAIEAAKRFAADVAEDMKVHWNELQTTHFIIFTDWDPQEFNFLTTNVEEAYAAVSKQFAIPVKENIFVGKLPVFMFAKQKDFQTFAQRYDELNADQLAGYYHSRSDGVGHMAMWKPDIIKNNGNIKQAQIRWAYVLTHEFTHAFVHRYRTNVRIARWLNEGLAEVIASSCFPRPEAKQRARAMAGANNQLIDPIFDDDQMPGGQYYPVMQTMVEMLIAKDTPRFIKMFNAIKDGEKTESALKKFYGVDYTGLTNAWRDYMLHPKGN